MRISQIKPTPSAEPTAPEAVAHVLLKKADLCRRLQMSSRTFEGMVKAGEFPSGVRIGRFKYWTESVVAKWTQRMFGLQAAWRPK